MDTLFRLVLAGKDRHIFQGRGIRQLRPLRGDVIALQGVLLPGFLPGRGLLGISGVCGLGGFRRLRGLGRLCDLRGFRRLGRLCDFRGFRGFCGLGRLGFFRRLGDFRRLRLLRGVQRLVLAVFGAASDPVCWRGVAQGHIPLIQKVHFNAAVFRQILAEGNGQASFLVIQPLLGVAGVQEPVLPVIGRHHKIVALSGGKGPVRAPVVDVGHYLGVRPLHLGGQRPVCVPGVRGAYHRDHGQHHGQRQQQTENSSAHIVFLLLLVFISDPCLDTTIVAGAAHSVNPPFFSYFWETGVPLPRRVGQNICLLHFPVFPIIIIKKKKNRREMPCGEY